MVEFGRKWQQLMADLVRGFRADVMRGLAEQRTSLEGQLGSLKTDLHRSEAQLEAFRADMQRVLDESLKRVADSEAARGDATLALQALALREADIADMRRRHAALASENARLTALLRELSVPDIDSFPSEIDAPPAAPSAAFGNPASGGAPHLPDRVGEIQDPDR